ncbi:putative phosphatidate phosphatase [Caerostris extrusa]|uniref:Phosphatidate phosphatase n=1 Tax=Caerostris extrusa TaxID=172846 RepID=A0AAV4QEU4_CAEEX|nr:putative phosphatidate phosphatase [Caerostris extrusa]
MIPKLLNDKFLTRVIIDLVLLIIVAIPIPLVYTGVFTPFKRGYFCDDETIRYPYKESTVSDTALYLGGLSFGIFSIILCEILPKFPRNSEIESELHLCDRKVPSVALSIYSSTHVFLFGVCIVEVLTNFIKYTLGRLRPNFIDVCQSDFNCSSLDDPYMYITNYTCTNPETYSVNDSRLSFPSGHSSIAGYVALFSIMYIHKYFFCVYTRLLKRILQFILLLIATYTVVSRIEDNKHHWSDVIGGLTVGIIIAIAVFLMTPCNFRREEEVSRREKIEKENEKFSINSVELYGSI